MRDKQHLTPTHWLKGREHIDLETHASTVHMHTQQEALDEHKRANSCNSFFLFFIPTHIQCIH